MADVSWQVPERARPALVPEQDQQEPVRRVLAGFP
jgi:hypothetical protein